jgi:hypothetical protein
MAQLHLYVPDKVADRLKQKAEHDGVSLSKYLASVVMRECGIDEWPPAYFETVVGRWKGGLQRPPQATVENRDFFD